MAYRRNAMVLNSSGDAKDSSEESRIKLSPSENYSCDQMQSIHLTEEQISAFREVFDLFDSNGGGTIDAEELNLALQSVDIHLSQDEIQEVLSAMDRDGNGEIDFMEFLNLMTNTERFLESFEQEQVTSTEEKHRRETLLFEALTQFMKKSALHSLQEIVGFYHTRYKRIQAPHVIGYYAAGARVFGLTEKQIQKHMETLKARHAAGDEKSPYAEPLHILFGQPGKKRKCTARRPRGRSILTAPEAAMQLRHEDDKSIHPGRIRLKFQIIGLNQEQKTETGKNQTSGKTRISGAAQATGKRQGQSVPRKLIVKRNGWVSQRFCPSRVQLPVVDVKPKHKQIRKTTKTTSALTFDDLPVIREKVAQARNEYFKRVHFIKSQECTKHWKSLGPAAIHSPVLREGFRHAFNTYTTYVTIKQSDER